MIHISRHPRRCSSPAQLCKQSSPPRMLVPATIKLVKSPLAARVRLPLSHYSSTSKSCRPCPGLCMRSTWSRILFSPQYHSNNFYFKLAVPFFTTIPSVAFSHMAGPSVVNMQSRKRPFLAGGGGRRAAVRRSTSRSGAGRRPGPDGALNPNAYATATQLFPGLFISSSNNADSDKFLQSSLFSPFLFFSFSFFPRFCSRHPFLL